MPTSSQFIYSDFAGGLDMFTERSKLGEGLYPLLINGRSRFGGITPIQKPLELTNGLPANLNYQGLYAVGNVSLVFAGGRGWVRDWSDADTGSFVPLAGEFQMNGGVKQLYLEVVPSSTVNFGRLSDGGDPLDAVLLNTSVISPSPVCAVVQDGISQPWIIAANGSARVTQGYQQWQNTADGREYVPVGKQMVFVDDKLYVADPDGKQIYQSVSGRPLDFMVVIDANGNKLSSEAEGGAQNVSNRVFYDAITCLARVSSPEGGFFVGSANNSFIVVPDFTDTIYGEPRFINRFVTSSGPLNQFSFVGDVDGDSTFIDGSSVKSFNSILQFRNTGKNSPFSLAVSRLFNGVDQSGITAAGEFDNYAIYSVMTTYGPAVLWYDSLRNCWESVDIYDNVQGYIRQFAQVIADNGVRKLLFLTSANKVYEWGGSSTTANCTLYLGDWNSGDPRNEFKTGIVKAVFNQPQSSGTGIAALFVDNKLQTAQVQSKTISASYTPSTGYMALPFGDSSERSVENVVFDFSRCQSGYKMGVQLSWNFQASLSFLSVGDLQILGGVNTMKRQQSEYLTNKQALGL